MERGSLRQNDVKHAYKTSGSLRLFGFPTPVLTGSGSRV